MGAFIDMQQGLLSEQKQKRLEREQKQKDKERQEKQELELFYTLDNIIYNDNKNKKQNIYNELHKPKNRDAIIEKITDNNNIQDIYKLTKKYNNILNNVYNAYKINDKNIIKEEKEAEKISPYYDILNNGEELEPKQEKKNYNFLIYLLGISIHFIICLFYFATRPRKRKRR